ncbi:MAG: dUTP diphosphatase [Candidatus Komeilibacteria bacterium]|jgi:dUTP pyrophosphatase|nr:dUTP diphosphatase [Candidatus Komeilibacteria bacterium]
MKIPVKKLHKDAQLPQMMKEGDAAMDFYSYKDYEIKPGARIIVETGVAIAIPRGYWGNVRDRGGLPAKHGIHTMGGVFDSNYRGEVQIILINLGSEIYNIKVGDRICQMIIEKHEDLEVEEVDELDETNRGEGRFASSGY